MPPAVKAYLEVGSKRVFGCAIDWPGWCRSGRDEDSALDALVAYGPRYRKALRRAGQGLIPPATRSGIKVAERVEGNATSDFGAPGVETKSDRRPLDAAEAKRQIAILRASWAAFDRTAVAAEGAELRRGPRGGGRELDAIVQHVLDADQAYLAKLGDKYRKPGAADLSAEMADVRKAIVELAASRARGEPPPRTPRSGSLWTPRYTVRRSAWHALDHAWEIEDRATTT